MTTAVPLPLPNGKSLPSFSFSPTSQAGKTNSPSTETVSHFFVNDCLCYVVVCSRTREKPFPMAYYLIHYFNMEIINAEKIIAFKYVTYTVAKGNHQYRRGQGLVPGKPKFF